MLRVGLTGGIGSGKSTVAALFARLGAPVIDTDEIARQSAAPGQPAQQEIVCAFGRDILDASRNIDRQRLRKRVFADPAERAKLEAILHPRIREAVCQKLETLRAPYCIVVVPLLIEAGFTDLVDRILVVDAAEGKQIQRAAARTGMGIPEIRGIMAAQISRAQRLQQADDVIVNNSDMTHLEQEVARLHAHYLSLAAAGSGC
jgi:dephospho-CoA kinase